VRGLSQAAYPAGERYSEARREKAPEDGCSPRERDTGELSRVKGIKTYINRATMIIMRIREPKSFSAAIVDWLRRAPNRHPELPVRMCQAELEFADAADFSTQKQNVNPILLRGTPTVPSQSYGRKLLLSSDS
jgi:hypothetical protein